MLAELVQAPVWRVRSWQRQGWLTPTHVTHRLAYFDFTELSVARQLAALLQAGVKPAVLAKKLAEISRRFPEIQRPLAELNLVVDGQSILVRRGDSLLEPGGQMRIDFELSAADAPEDSPDTVPAAAVFLARSAGLAHQQAPEQLLAWAAKLDEEGNLAAAAEMFRAALAASGPQAELCFQLAEVLYRAGDLPAARERYFMALELDENYVEARANLGCVLLDLGERELAVAAFEGALGLHEAYADVHYHLARTLDSLGRQIEAAAHWARFAELAPDSPWAEEALARVGEGERGN